jgi:hypothetical protein
MTLFFSHNRKPAFKSVLCHSIGLNLRYDVAEAVTGVSLWRTSFYPMVDNMGVAVDEEEFRQAFSHHLGFPLPMFHIHLSMKG